MRCNSIRRSSERARSLLGLGLLALTLGCAGTGGGEGIPAQEGSATGEVPSSPPRLRVAAEWEPALGVLVSWPPFLPHRLLVELARDSRLYVLVAEAAAEEEARSWLEGWGVDLGRVEFLEVPRTDDAAWTRDWGPHPVFGVDGRLRLGDARYDLSTPDSALDCDAELLTPWNGGWGGRFQDYDVTLDDAAPTAVANAWGLEALEVPFVLTGGNFMTDGRGAALSSCILTNENRRNGLSEEQFFEQAAELLGLERYTILPNFEDEGIQHIDCLLKLLDDRRILLARPPADHPLFERYQAFADEILPALECTGGGRYEVLRLDTAPYRGEALAAYTNSLILNDVVYVPLFGIPQDRVALDQWQAALPGHRVKGFEFRLEDEPILDDQAHRMYDELGWRSFDALHCRTRAVWDPHMLHLAVDRVPPTVRGATGHVVRARIVAYSGEPILARRLVVRWRLKGLGAWLESPLTRSADGTFEARIAEGVAAGPIEYYVLAADASGREERAPRQAPEALYRFVVER
jgi:agmatine deiminase